MATHSSILAGKIPWQRRLAGCSPWGRKESVMTEHTHTQTGNQRIAVVIVYAPNPCFPFHTGNAVPFSIESLKRVLSHVLQATEWNY